VSKEETKGKNMFEGLKKQTIEVEDWDKTWLEDLNLENKRYKNRLIVKSNRQNNSFLRFSN
jgi:hypothetical protein